jgi:ubiquinone/menaquinone biosynthesis C-methylase UbiE
MNGTALHPSAAAAVAEWAVAVRANREQVERVREDLAGTDHYAPIASFFREDPRRSNDKTLDLLRTLVVPGETWLDIGAGGGRLALPLALVAGEVIAVDPSEGMLRVLRQAMADFAISNVRVVQGRWPAASPIPADVALIAHVGYDVEDIGDFLDGMERSARRQCVAVLLEHPPPSPFDELWPAVHGEARATLPALPEFLALLLARGTLFEVRFAERWAQTFATLDDLMALARRQLWTRPDSPKDQRLRQLISERAAPRDGGVMVSVAPSRLGVVTWSPPTSR